VDRTGSKYLILLKFLNIFTMTQIGYTLTVWVGLLKEILRPSQPVSAVKLGTLPAYLVKPGMWRNDK